MKLLHLSDLHLGKRVNEFSMLEDQAYILTKIINIVDDEQPDAIVIAGDVYDKSMPSAEAVALFDDFLARLAARRLKVFVISGNHDSPERIAFGARIMNQSDIYMSPVYSGDIEPVKLEDAHGAVRIYMLPFIKPAHVRRYCEDDIASYTDAVRAAVCKMPIDPTARNILITHQFVTGASRCDSEDISVGGTDNVDAAAFDAFDYVALGHIHSPQNVTRETIRYCGSPLKYSFSEAGQQKSVTVVSLGEKGRVELSTVPLIPKHDLQEIKGTYAEVTRKSFYEHTSYPDDYMHVTLTDEEDIPDAVGKLRSIYHNLMKLDYDNQRTRAGVQLLGDDAAAQKSPLTLLGEFYEKQNNQPMNAAQQTFSSQLIEEIWEG